MSRINVFELCNAISNEDNSSANVDLEGKKDVEPQVTTDEGNKTVPDDEVNSAVTNTNTSEPGPENGGGDGTGVEVNVNEVTATNSVSNHVTAVDQTGLGDVEQSPDKVDVKDGLTDADVSTSVEEHAEALDTIESGETEPLDEKRTDDMVMDIDEATSEMDINESEDKGKVIDGLYEDQEEIEKVQASIENYMGILNTLESKGLEVSPELAKAINIGLESFDSEYFNKVVVSVEDMSGEFIDKDENDTSTSVSKKGLSAKAKEIFEAAKRIFYRILNAAIDFYRSVMTDTTKLEARLKDLRKKINVLGGGEDLELSGGNRLSIAGQYVGDSTEALDNVLKTGNTVLIDWPSDLAKIVKTFNDSNGWFYGVKPGTHAKMVDGVADLFSKSFRSFNDISPNSKDKVPSGLLDSTKVYASKVLPGDRAFYVGFNTDKFNANEQDLLSAVHMNFSLTPDGESGQNKITIKTMTSGEALSVIKKLEQIIALVKQAKDKSEIQTLKKTVESSHFRNVFSGSRDSTYGVILALHLSKLAVKNNYLFAGYLISLVKAEIALIEACIKTENANVIEGELA